MNPSEPVKYREADVKDADAIATVIGVAFTASRFGLHNEITVARTLLGQTPLCCAMLAEDGTGPVGCAVVSPVTISGHASHWYGLGPVAVVPGRQQQGIGSRLVQGVLAHLQAHRAAGCVVLGSPALYGRFGFQEDPGLTLPGYDRAHFLVLRWRDRHASGSVRYHPVFYDEDTRND